MRFLVSDGVFIMLSKSCSIIVLAVLATAAATSALMIGIGNAQAAGSQFCKLDRNGNGLRSCQCYVLQHRLARPRVLSYLSGINACSTTFSSFQGGGSSSVIIVSNNGNPVIPQPTDPEPVCDNGFTSRPEASNPQDANSGKQF
jgi:hypothetical protein